MCLLQHVLAIGNVPPLGALVLITTSIGSSVTFCAMVGSDMAHSCVLNATITIIGSTTTFCAMVGDDVVSLGSSNLATIVALLLDVKETKREDV